MSCLGLPQWLSGEEAACSAGGAGDAGSIPGQGRPPGGGDGTPPVFLPGQSHGQGAWRAAVCGPQGWDQQCSAAFESPRVSVTESCF